MSEEPTDPVEQMWQHIDELERLANDIRKVQGEAAAQPLIALMIRMGDTLSDIEQRPDE